MSDQVDSGQAGLEGGESQTPEPLQPNGDSERQHSLAGSALVQAMKNDPEAFEEARRLFQSEKDKGVAKATQMAQQALSEVERLAPYLKMTPEEIRAAKREMYLDAMIDGQGESNVPVSGQGQRVVQERASSLDILGAFQAVGLSPDNADDVQFAASFDGNQTELQNALLVRRAGKPAPRTTSPSTAVQPGGRTVSPGEMASLESRRDAILSDSRYAISKAGQDELAKIAQDMAALEN